MAKSMLTKREFKIPKIVAVPKNQAIVKDRNESYLPSIDGSCFAGDINGELIPAQFLKNGYVNPFGEIEVPLENVTVVAKRPTQKSTEKFEGPLFDSARAYSGNISNHPDAAFMSQAYWESEIKNAKRREEADRMAAQVNPMRMLTLASAGILNYISSPSQTVRAVADNLTGHTKEYIDGKFLNGNNGFVTDNFAEEHPFLSFSTNFLSDLCLTGSLLRPYPNIKRGLSNVTKPLKGKKFPFKSELDWSAEAWLGKRINGKYDEKDIRALKAHIPEYHRIEKKAKENGTWLKMPDGSIWEGDPRSWVQLQSKDAQYLSKQIWWHGERPEKFRGNPDEYGDKLGNIRLWCSSNPTVARSYAAHDNYTIPFAIEESQNPQPEINANGASFGKIKHGKQSVKTDDLVDFYLPGNNNIIIKNVIDPGGKFNDALHSKQFRPKGLGPGDLVDKAFIGDNLILNKGTIRKSLIGNNGSFDYRNPNIFKVGIPAALGSEIIEFGEKPKSGRYNNQK